MRRTLLAIATLAACTALPAVAANNGDWTTPVAPHKIYGNTYYVGTKGLSAILVTSPQGHVLIDVPMSDNVALIEANIRKLGFRVEDVKLVLNSHAHFDHAGGIAQFAKDSGATVRATPAGAKEMQLGGDDATDPQHGEAPLYAKVDAIGDINDGTVVRVGTLALTAHITPGHTPGGTAWTWTSCEGKACKTIAYVDSLFAFSADGYRYSDHPAYVAEYRKTFDRVAALPCDMLITPHPSQGEGKTCAAYAKAGRQRLDEKLAEEAKP
ncbi:metallo-beta-lactamase class B [Luteibacter jiangsuensis]|uniref:Metallo-beta-lactamase class B n=1 Tax=Luteibacter jiangsuensis TaxID=637577 RepID=A0ABT9SWJ7_9GAMM|nr:subclass B3 metallo-beta-lactamase [Luteibacter jiangsuensis]MDQ0009386.1 metallo-beta-lactamase class B [Luteibacter jiangsuensis]